MTKDRRRDRDVSVGAREPACEAMKGMEDAEHWKQEGMQGCPQISTAEHAIPSFWHRKDKFSKIKCLQVSHV